MRELEAQFPVFACVIRLDGRHSGSATGKEDEHRRDRHAELIEASRQVIQRLHGLIQKRLLQAIRQPAQVAPLENATFPPHQNT